MPCNRISGGQNGANIQNGFCVHTRLQLINCRLELQQHAIKKTCNPDTPPESHLGSCPRAASAQIGRQPPSATSSRCLGPAKKKDPLYGSRCHMLANPNHKKHKRTIKQTKDAFAPRQRYQPPRLSRVPEVGQRASAGSV